MTVEAILWDYSEIVYYFRIPKCNTVLQSESDLFEPEIQPDSPGNCKLWALIRTIKSSECFGHCSVRKINEYFKYFVDDILFGIHVSEYTILLLRRCIYNSLAFNYIFVTKFNLYIINS